MPPEPGPHPFPFGASSNEYGSPQAQFDIPYGNLAQNCGYAQIANLYASRYGYDPRALAKIAADQRASACANPDAIFFGQPISIDDVLNSPMIADPIHLLEIVMPVAGGAAVVVTGKERAARARHRPVRITGFGERLAFKTPTYSADLLRTPIAAAAARAFAVFAGFDRGLFPDHFAGSGVAEMCTRIIEPFLNIEDLKPRTIRVEVRYMQSVTMTKPCRMKALSIVVEDHRTEDDLVPAVRIDVGNAQIVVALAAEFTVLFARIAVKDPALS